MCTVSGGALLAASVLSASASAATVAAVSAIGAAAIGAGIGVAVNGAINLATGQSFFKGAGMSALMGGASAGIGSAFSSAATSAGATTASQSADAFAKSTQGLNAVQGPVQSSLQAFTASTTAQINAAQGVGLFTGNLNQAAINVGGQLASGTGIALSAGGSSALRAMTPEFAEFSPQLAQAFNPAESKITGSGGTQAAGVLAASIQAVKKRRERQTLTGDVGLGTFTNTGLQFA